MGGQWTSPNSQGNFLFNVNGEPALLEPPVPAINPIPCYPSHLPFLSSSQVAQRATDVRADDGARGRGRQFSLRQERQKAMHEQRSGRRTYGAGLQAQGRTARRGGQPLQEVAAASGLAGCCC